MGSTVGSRIKSGKVTGTAADIKIALEFTPSRVELFNATGLAKGDWSESMAQDSMVVQVTDGTMTFVVAEGITAVSQLELDSGADPTRGFVIGPDTDLNVAAEIIHWIAYE